METDKFNKDYKLIAFDMDGTLLDSNKHISNNVRDAIMNAYNKGKIIVLETGRNIAELRDYRSIEAFRYVIAISGSYIYDLKENKAMVTDPIPKESVIKLLGFLKERNIHFGVHSNDYHIDKEVLDNPEKHHIELLVNTLSTFGIATDSVYDLYKENEMDIYKINIYLNSSKQRDEIRKELVSYEDEFEIVYSDGYTLEFSKKGTNKGNGLKYLCDYLNIDINDAIAVGDNENDIEALKAAGLGIAVDNATSIVKEVCDVVVSSNDNDGCKEAIEKYLLKINI